LKPTALFALILIFLPQITVMADQGKTSTTFFGGSGDEAFSTVGLASDTDGNIYLAGVTSSLDIPATSNAYQKANAGNKDVFVAKFTPDLKTLLACTYLGGSSEEMSCEIRVTSSGDVAVSGSTASGDFPIVGGPQPEYGGGTYDVYIALLSGDLGTLKGSSYLGGRNKDLALRGHLASDLSGNIIISCYTESPDFPVTEEAYDTTYGGSGDGGVAVFSPDVKRLVAASYIGGSGNDWPYPMAFGGGRVYVGGHTNSQSYPTTQGAYDSTYNGGDGDVFIAALDPLLKTLMASTFLGASDFDNINSIYVEKTGDVVVTGHTGSRGFPTTEGAYSRVYKGGERDSFVTRLDADLKVLKSSTFIGGSDSEYQAVSAPGKGGDVLVSGATTSTDYPYVSASALGGIDTTINVFNSALSSVKLSIPAGGPGDEGFGSIIYANEVIYVATSTKSSGIQCTGYDSSFNGGQDVLLIRLEYPGDAPVQPTQGGNQPPGASGIPAFPTEAVLVGLLIVLIIWQSRHN
jgi:hypothetical protein